MPKTVPNKPTTYGFWYLASPYTSPNYHVRLERARMAMHAVARLLPEGITAFSPIHYYSSLAEEHGLAFDHEFWLDHNSFFMQKCAGCIVLTLDGWQESKGVQAEIEWFRRFGRAIFLMEPGNAKTFQPLD